MNEIADAAASLDAQRALLRRWLLDRDEIPAVNSDETRSLADWSLQTKTDRHARIAFALVTLKAAGMPTDVISLTDYLDRREEIIGAGGRAYIFDLLDA